MKQTLKTVSVFLLLGFACLAARAQETSTTPKWISEKGFWVVEKTADRPDQCTIYFYNNDKELVYQEDIAGKIKLHKRKTLMYIKSVLETAIAASEKKQSLPGNEKFFAGAGWK